MQDREYVISLNGATDTYTEKEFNSDNVKGWLANNPQAQVYERLPYMADDTDIRDDDRFSISMNGSSDFYTPAEMGGENIKGWLANNPKAAVSKWRKYDYWKDQDVSADKDEATYIVDDNGKKKEITAAEYHANRAAYTPTDNRSVTRNSVDENGNPVVGDADYMAHVDHLRNMQQLQEFMAQNGPMIEDWNKKLEEDTKHRTVPMAGYNFSQKYPDMDFEKMNEILAERDRLVSQRNKNPYYQKLVQGDIDAANALLGEITGMVKEAQPKRRESEVRNEAEMFGGQFGSSSMYSYLKRNAGLSMADRKARNITQDALRVLQAPDKESDKKNGFINFLKGGEATLSDPAFWTDGISKIIDNAEVKKSVDAIRKKLGGRELTIEDLDNPDRIGDILSPDEVRLIKALGLKMNADFNRALDTSNMYRAGQTATESLKFMLEFIATGKIAGFVENGIKYTLAKGAGDVAKGGISGAFNALAGKAGESVAARGAIRATEALVKPAVSSFIRMWFMPSTYENISDAKAYQMDYSTGHLKEGKLKGKDIVDQWVEVWSETALEPIIEFTGNGLGYIGKSKKVQNVSRWIKEQPLGNFAILAHNSDYAKFLRQAGFHGYLEEMMEEALGAGTRQVLGIDDNAWEQFWDKEQLGQMAVAFLPMSLAGAFGVRANIKRANRNFEQERPYITDILMRGGLDVNQAQNLLNKKAHTMDEIASNINEVVRKAKDSGKLTEEDRQHLISFAAAQAQKELYESIQKMDFTEENKRVSDDIEQSVGNKYWQGEAPEEGQPDLRQVETIVYADGRRLFVTAKDDNGYACVDEKGNRQFLSAEEYANQQAEGLIASNETKPINDFLTDERQARANIADQERQARDAQQYLQAVQDKVEEEKSIPVMENGQQVGTLTVVETTPDGVTIADGEGYTNLTWQEVADRMGMPTQGPSADAVEEAQDATEIRMMDVIADLNKMRGTRFDYQGASYNIADVMENLPEDDGTPVQTVTITTQQGNSITMGNDEAIALLDTLQAQEQALAEADRVAQEQAQTAEETLQEPEQEVSQLESPEVPTDEKGRKLYTQAPVELTYADIYGNPAFETREEADGFVAGKAKRAKEAAGKAQEKVDKIKSENYDTPEQFRAAKDKAKAELQPLVDAYNYWNSLKEFAKAAETQPQVAATEPQAEANTQEVNAPAVPAEEPATTATEEPAPVQAEAPAAEEQVQTPAPAEVSAEEQAPQQAVEETPAQPQAEVSMKDEIFADTLAQAPEDLKNRITIRKSSTGDEKYENFVQSYDIDGKPSGITRMELFEAQPTENPTFFLIDGSEITASREDQDRWEELAGEYEKLNPDVHPIVMDEAGIAFRNFADAYAFRQWAEEQAAKQEPESPEAPVSETSSTEAPAPAETAEQPQEEVAPAEEETPAEQPVAQSSEEKLNDAVELINKIVDAQQRRANGYVAWMKDKTDASTGEWNKIREETDKVIDGSYAKLLQMAKTFTPEDMDKLDGRVGYLSDGRQILNKISASIEEDARKSRVSAFIQEEQKTIPTKAKPVGKINLYSAAGGAKDYNRPALMGVFHDNGYAVASDAHILLADAEQYNKKKNGKIIGREGKAIDKTYPNWRSLFDKKQRDGERTAKMDFGKLRDFIASARAQREAEWQQKKDAGENVESKKDYVNDSIILLNVGDNTVIGFKLSSLSQFADFAEKIGAKEVRYIDSRKPIVIETKKGVGLLMPVMEDLKTPYGNFNGNERELAKEMVERGRFSYGQNEYQKNVAAEAKAAAQKENAEKAQAYIAGETPEQYQARKEEARRAPIRARIADWNQRLGINTQVFESRDDVKNTQALSAIDNGEAPAGWYVPSTKTVNFYMPNITDEAHVDRLFMHEVVSHRGLRELLGEERFNELMDSVWKDLMTEEDHTKWLDYVSYMENASEQDKQRAAADEYVAHLAEDLDSAENATKWERFVAKVREILQKIGIDLKLTEADLQTLLRASLANYEQRQADVRQKALAEQEKRQEAIAAIEGEKTKATDTAAAANNPQVAISGAQEKYDDFGQKIGMARKDIAVTPQKRGNADDRPAWMKKYDTMNVEMLTESQQDVMNRFGAAGRNFREVVDDITKGTNFEKPFVGFWVEEKKTYYGVRKIKHYITGENYQPIIFTSKDQYDATLPVFEAKEQKYRVGQKGNKWIIYRYASNKKAVEYAEFDTKEDAAAYLASPEGATSLLNRKRENFELPALTELTRVGMPDYRNGRNITPDDIMKTFGFRGGEFGNWLNADERQQFLNYAYDALMDLANILGVTPHALTLNGELSIAFGARGRQGAAAHYEPDRAVINLTKMHGAGSLAHEWGHALDNYFGLMDAKRTRIRERGRGIAQDWNLQYLSEGTSYNRGVRREVADAFKNVMNTLKTKEVTRVIELEKTQKEIDDYRKYADKQLGYYIDRYKAGRRTMKYNRKTKGYDETTYKLTDEQLDQLRTLAAQLDADKTFSWHYEMSKGGYRAHGDVAKQMYDLIAEVAPDRKENMGPLNDFFYYYSRVHNLLPRLEAAKNGETETVKVDTKVYEDSKWFDKDRAGSYYSSDKEMFARGIEAFVMATMREQGQTSDYLTYDKGSLYQHIWGHSPYAIWDELTPVKEAYRALFDTIQEKTDEETRNQVLFSKEDMDNSVSLPYDRNLGTTQREGGEEEEQMGMGSISSGRVDDGGRESRVYGQVPDMGVWGTRYHISPRTGSIPIEEVEALFHDFNTNPELDSLFEKVINLEKQYGIVDAYFVNPPRKDMSGGAAYNGAIIYSPRLLLEEDKHSEIPETITHELIHSFTIGAIELGKTPGKLLAEQQAAIDELNAIHEELKANPKKDNSIGKKNLDHYLSSTKELVAGMSDPKFRDYLRGIKSGDRTMWQRIVDAIKRLLGINKDAGTAFEVVDRALNELLERFDINTYEATKDMEVSDEDGMGYAQNKLRTYHGTGADFERFDHSHMGEGEGNQAFGWGTYVAENPDVAKEYAIHYGAEGSRHLYTVNIPEDNGENYLHWDQPITNRQSLAIMAEVRKRLGDEAYDIWGDEFDRELMSVLGYGTYGSNVEGGLDYFLGNEYDYETDENPGAKRNAELLNSVGIVGIEIPMGGARRSADKPGSDYVIFNENDLEITENVQFSKAQQAQKLPNKEYVDEVELEDIRFSLSKNNRRTIETWFNKRKDLTAGERESVINYLDGIDNSTQQLAAARWFALGKIRLPEDMPKVEQAVDVAGKAKVDPLQYDSPMALLDAHADFKPSEKRINPDDVETLHRAEEYPEYGIVVYDVDDSEESRQNMRRIINTHFGKDSSPWCLLQGDGEGNLTRDSKKYWNHYNAYPKQVAFQNGKLTSFSANDDKTRAWWDRQDKAHYGIPFTKKIDNDPEGRSAEYELSYDGKTKMSGHPFRGNKINGAYEEWYNWEIMGVEPEKAQLAERYHFKDGKIDGLLERWQYDGILSQRATYKNGELDGLYESFNSNGGPRTKVEFKNGDKEGLQELYYPNGNLQSRQVNKKNRPNGLVEVWYDNGQLERRGLYVDGVPEGIIEEWYPNGQLQERKEYHNGYKNGILENWYDNGQLRARKTYKDNYENGVSEIWYEDGTPKSVENFRDGLFDGLQVRYNTDGKIVRRQSFKNGVADGLHESYWWDSGEITESTMYRNGQRHGIHKEWDMDGNLKTLVEFKNNRLVRNLLTAGWTEEQADKYQEELNKDAEKGNPTDVSGDDIRFSKRTKEDPKKVKPVYKLMRLGEDGKLYPLFIDSTEPLEIGQWYDADSPNMDMLKSMPEGVFLVDYNNGDYTSLRKYARENEFQAKKFPRKEDVEQAAADGLRWVYIEPTKGKQARYEGENRKYWNLGINGSGSVSTFAMRPGWHAGSLPTMRQIGKGANRDLRDDSFVWVKGSIPADVNYQQEADKNPGKDIPTHIPTDGYYLKATNADSKKSQADKVGWYVAGSFRPDRILSDSEAREIIDRWNAINFDSEPVEYDYPRESGRTFNAQTMQLEGGEDIRFSKQVAADLYDRYTNQDGEEKPWMSEDELIRDTEEQLPYGVETEHIFQLIDKYHRLDNEDFEEGRRDFSGGEKSEVFDQIVNALREYGDADKTDIRFAKSNANQAIFVSNAQKAVEGIQMEKATPEQWLKMLENKGGLKAGEDKWLGLSDWLKESDKKTLTKQELLDFIGENGIKIEETHYAQDVELEDVEALEQYNDEFNAIITRMMDERKESISPIEPALVAGDAFNEMVSHYGDDFSLAFEYVDNQDGTFSLEPYFDEFRDELGGAAKYFLDQKRKSGEERINTTRLHYTTDGLENKHEIALTVPTIEPWNKEDLIHFGDAGEGRAVSWIRFGDAHLKDGAPILVIDEVQSKRHQTGRERGYQGEIPHLSMGEFVRFSEGYDDMWADVTNDLGESVGKIVYGPGDGGWYWGESQSPILTTATTKDPEKALADLAELLSRKQVPQAPFEKNWPELSMKRMLRFAAENNYDHIAWTTGDQQAERYNIGGVLNSIERREHNDLGERDYRLNINGRGNQDIITDDNGNVIRSIVADFRGKNLADIVGKNVAEKALQMKENESIEGDDFRVGGEGMRGFYDEILPRFMNKYCKKWGVQTEDLFIPDIAISEMEDGLTMHSIKVTPEMKQSVMEGQVMFSKAEDTIEKEAEAAEETAEEAKQTLRDEIRSVGKRLAEYRKVAAAQRKYDRETVDAVAHLARRMMDEGLLTDLSALDVKRLLSSIRSSVGKAHLDAAVNRIVELVADNQLRRQKNALKDAMSTKATKVNQGGVQVQGALDVAGQTALKTFKTFMGNTIEDIEARIAETENRLTSDDAIDAARAAAELDGLKLAQLYSTTIDASIKEEYDLRQALQTARTERRAGKLTEKAYREFVADTEDAIRENRSERIDAYDDMIQALREMISGSRERAAERAEAEKARVEQIHHFANSDMQGMPDDEHGNKNDRWTNNAIIRWLNGPLATFDQMLRAFGRKSVRGEGYLFNKFLRGWNEARDNEISGIRSAKKELDKKVQDVFGDKHMRWSDLYSKVRSMPTVKVNFWDGGEMKGHDLTQGNLLYIYMVNKMTDGRMKLRRMGITQEDVDAIVKQMDPKFIEIADWLQDTFLKEKRNKYNEVYERMFGAPMAAIENYFPLRINARSRVQEQDVAKEDVDAKPSTITNSIIKRVRNAQALDVLNADAFAVTMDHIEEMEHWAAFAEYTKDLNTLLSYKHFRNQVENMSTLFYGAGNVIWRNFLNSAKIAVGKYQPVGKKSETDRNAVNIAKGVTTAKISFRLYTAIKQLLSFPAYFSDANIFNLAKNLAMPRASWKWSMENLPMFRERWESRMAGDSRLMNTDDDWKLWQKNAVKLASRLGLSPNAFVDAVTVAIGAKSMYETRKAAYLKDGYSEEKAEKKAKQDAEILYNETQQSTEGAFLSAMQLDRTWASTSMTVFRNSSMGYERQMLDALRNFSRRFGPGYKEASIGYMTKQMIRDGIPEDGARKAAERLYNKAIVRDAVRVAIFGYVLPFAWNLGFYLPYLIFGDDDDKKEQMLKDAARHGMFGPIEGLSAGNVLSEIGNIIARDGSINKVQTSNLTLMPVASDMQRLLTLSKTDKVAAANELVNLGIQATLGVNPQTFTDMIVAVIDACNGDLEASKEAMMLIMRIMNVPQSQLDQLYLDEVGMTAAEAKDKPVDELARRYAEYRVKRGAPLTGWAYSDEEKEKQIKKYEKQFSKKIKERKSLNRTAAEKAYDEWVEDVYKPVTKTLNQLEKDAKDANIKGDQMDFIEKAQRLNEFRQSEIYQQYALLKGRKKAIDKVSNKMEKVDPDSRIELEKMLLDLKNEFAKELTKNKEK